MTDQPTPQTEAGHTRCGERLKCPCWMAGAREEGEMHRTRVTTRQLTDYIRALGDNDPVMTMTEVADAVHHVFGSAQARTEVLDVDALAQAMTEAAPSRVGIYAEAEAVAREYAAILAANAQEERGNT
jgi:hypothetical protein